MSTLFLVDLIELAGYYYLYNYQNGQTDRETDGKMDGQAEEQILYLYWNSKGATVEIKKTLKKSISRHSNCPKPISLQEVVLAKILALCKQWEEKTT